mgnify:CR=1 FL=1
MWGRIVDGAAQAVSAGATSPAAANVAAVAADGHVERKCVKLQRNSVDLAIR